MSKRVSRVGTADKPLTVEENVGRLEVKMKEMELKMELKEKADEIQKNNFTETVEMFKTEIRDIKDNLIQTIKRIETFEVKNHEEKAGLGKRMIRNEENIQQTNDKVERVANALEHVQEKMYDFEANKKNNLIFNGIPNEAHEMENKLIIKSKELIRANMKVRRELVISTASSLSGPKLVLN